VLKVSLDRRETRSEIAALSNWNGRAAARLLQADPELGALLLEKVEPGNMLAYEDGIDEDCATRIAAGLLRQLWIPADGAAGLIPLDEWCAAYSRTRQELSRGVVGFPNDLFVRADALRAELLASTSQPVALHGDLHHFNILQSDRAGWLAIDPKGLCGDRCFDICQFLLNPGPVSIEVNRRRLRIFCDELDLDLERARRWCLVHAVLNACWDLEDGLDVEPRVAYAHHVLEL
jgi:streptomycin 6-kinase